MLNKIWLEMKENSFRLLLSFFFFSLAASFNAGMDTIEYRYSQSVFTELGDYWQHDWTRKYEKDENGNILYDDAGKPVFKKWLGIINVHPAFFDGWHLLKVLMIATIVYTFLFLGRRIPITARNLILYTLLYGIAWNLAFSLCFDYLFILSNWQ